MEAIITILMYKERIVRPFKPAATVSLHISSPAL